jgi:hypothetical protein
MAFAGDYGAAANLIPFALISSKQYGVASGYDADDNLQFTTPGGTTVTPESVQDLVISAGNDVLAALLNNTDDGSAVDSGALVSAAAIANEHGLPANFGPGRGNWTQLDLINLNVESREEINTVAAITNTGGPVVRAITLAGSNVGISIKNMSEVVLASQTLRIRLDHSIQA